MLNMQPAPDPELVTRARALVDQLAALVADYPTGDHEAPVILLRATVAGQEVGTVPLMPGHAEWLRRVVAAEHATADASHPDMSGECGHCAGTGSARTTRG